MAASRSCLLTSGVYNMVLFLILCILAAVFLGGSYYAYRVAFYNSYTGREGKPSVSGAQYDAYRVRMREIYQKLSDRPCEFVTIQSQDGLTLSGRYYHVKDGAPLDICFHGYRSSPLTDFSGGSELSFDMGHNVLLVDQRAHGRSEGRTITFGIKERWDLMCWVDYALERFGADTRILLYGVSMGGATVLMASELALPENVKGIIADCPYSSPMDVILYVGQSNPIPNWLIRPFVILGAKIFGGFDVNEATAASAVKNTRVPILIIHGDGDSYVPCDMSDLAVHNPNMVTRYTFPGAEHGISYLADTPRYQKLVTEFMEKIL